LNVRLWTLHPTYLDARGLVALWREGLLAQAVLRGRTTGYVHHPQLARFRDRSSPVGAIAEYLRVIHAEAVGRGYSFSSQRVSRARASGLIDVTHGQLMHEWGHLMAKLERRDPERRAQLLGVKRPKPHPLFRIVRGDVETWEKIATTSRQDDAAGDVSRRRSARGH
jgi:hypothetical protein